MNKDEICALFDHDERIAVEYPEAIKETTPEVVRFRREPPGMNFIEYAWLTSDNIDRVIAEQIAYYTQFDQPYEWNVYAHDQPADLRERLAAHGFIPEDDPGALMVLEVEKAPATLFEPNPIDIRPVTGPDGLEEMIRLEETVWGSNFGWMRKRFGDALKIPGLLSIYIAYVDGQPACAGWSFFNPNSQFAFFYGGSTLPEYRQRGLYTAVLGARVQEVRRRGLSFAVVDAGPMSQPILARHGFWQFSTLYSMEGPKKIV